MRYQCPGCGGDKLIVEIETRYELSNDGLPVYASRNEPEMRDDDAMECNTCATHGVALNFRVSE